ELLPGAPPGASLLVVLVRGVLVLVGLAERRGGEDGPIRIVHLRRAELAIAFARADGERSLRVHLEGHQDARLTGAAPRDAVDDPPAFVAQLLCAAAGAAQHVHGDAALAVADGGEALGRAGRDLAATLDELGGGATGRLDADGLPAGRRRGCLLAACIARDPGRAAGRS